MGGDGEGGIAWGGVICILEMALKGGFSYVGRMDRKLCWPRRGNYGVYYQGSSEVESPQE